MVSYQSFWPQTIICRKRMMYLAVACIYDFLPNTFLNDKDFILKIIANDVVVWPFFAKIIRWRSRKCSSLSASWVLFCNFIFDVVFTPHHFALIVRHWIWLYQLIVFFYISQTSSVSRALSTIFQRSDDFNKHSRIKYLE